jgi:hypothetical protein
LNTAHLNLSNNNIQYNGQAGNLAAADGVFIRVSSDSYLAADLQNNRIAGNVGTDLHFESFMQYNPNTGATWEPPRSIRGTPSTVFWDNTAQMDLRMFGNVGNSVAAQNPLVNGNGALLGNITPNGAVVAPDPSGLKANNQANAGPDSFTNPFAHIVQLFEIDNGNNLNSNNSFISNGITQDLQNTFFQGDFAVRVLQDPAFPNPLFPQPWPLSPGNPFLP